MQVLEMSTENVQSGGASRRTATLRPTLAELSPLQLPEPAASLCINDIVIDSRNVEPGNLFIAVSGLSVDGRDYIDPAIKSGAAAVFVESSAEHAGVEVSVRQGVPIVSLPGLPRLVSDIAARFFQRPADKLSVIGITGTNGKTSCSHFVALLAAQLSLRCAVMGTLGVGFIAKSAQERNAGHPQLMALRETGYTTPDAVSVQKLLAELHSEGCEMVAMEVSSHALVQHRVRAVPVKVAIFTNLSRDHLDFHDDMQAYGSAKQLLFSQPGLETAVINIDDEWGRKIVASLGGDIACLSYSLENPNADIYASDIRYELSGLSARITTPWGSRQFSTQLLGAFNLSNCLAALAAMLASGADFESLMDAASQLHAVDGRMQLIPAEALTVVVDYAHTPQALEFALCALRPHTRGAIRCVFGCGGDRDKGKRAEMGRAASEYADHIVLTSDNPRFEPAQQIIDDILLGIEHMENLVIEIDRAAAIAIAIERAEAGDVILVAGKGHEKYQEINGTQSPFYDVEQVQQCLQGRSR